MIERRTIVFGGFEHPAYEARGATDGPHVALIGGIHGCEYSSIAAVTRFMNELDTTELAGSITAVPVVSMQSFLQRSAFVVPEDGKNLNRSFPGSHDGTYTDALAASIFEQVIEPADVLLDLHGGDLVEALEPFAIYDASPVEERAHAIALAFGLPYVVRQERAESGLGGMTSTTVRHRTVRTKGALSTKTAKLMVFKLVTAAAKTWRRLKGENQLPKVVKGVKFQNGIEVTEMPAHHAA